MLKGLMVKGEKIMGDVLLPPLTPKGNFSFIRSEQQGKSKVNSGGVKRCCLARAQSRDGRWPEQRDRNTHS